MSISSKNKEKKNKGTLYDKIIGGYKKEIDLGKKIEDLNFNVFDDEKDYFINFIKSYINCKKKEIGFEI
jgi:hypothetical protein